MMIGIKSNKFLMILLIAGILIVLKGIQADAYVGGVFTYTKDNQSITYKVLSEPTVSENGAVEIIYWEGINQKLAGDVIIPQIVTNQKMTYNVTRIGGDAFSEAGNITNIILPDTIIYIGAYAFRNCSSLVNINIPEGVTVIEDGTFYGCSSLVRIHLPDKITSIGRNAFADSKKLTAINLPEGVKKIGSSAFSGCDSLESINIPEGITVIESKLFEDCINLAEVSLPESITRIGDRAFYNCNQLKNIHLSDAITSIGEYAFYKCSSLTSIKIPYKVTKIENQTFLLCSGLNNVRIPDRVTSIGDLAFYGCSSLISVSLPDSVTNIGDYAFFGCESLRPLKIPESVVSIGVGEFPYTGVQVYKNSFAETFFKKNYPKYYQVIKQPLEEMLFVEDIKNIGIGDAVQIKPVFYPVNSTDITDNITFSSSDTQVVSVGFDGTIKGLSAGEATITAVMGDYSAVCRIIVGSEPIKPVSVQFTSDRFSMNKGESKRLFLQYTPDESTNRAVTWISSDNSVVSVDNGRIYAKAAGTAVITAQTEAGTTNCSITVYNPLQEIYSDYNEITLNKGETKKIGVSYYPIDTTDDKSITWSIEEPSVASIDNGVITALKPGTTNVIAMVGKFTHTIPLNVQIPLKALGFTKKSISLTAGETQTFWLLAEPQETTADIHITSSDESVAVYTNGTIIAKKRGTAVITATSGSLSAACVVTVNTDIKSISFNKSAFTLYYGLSKTLKVTYNPANPADDKTVTYISSDESVVTVDSKGKVRTVGTGKATITAIAAGNKKAVTTVTVRLSRPKAVKAVSKGYDRVKVSFKAVRGADGYVIYRSLSKAGSYKKVKVTPYKSFTNTRLKTGTAYYYKVRAYRYKGNKKVYSRFTAPVYVKPIPAKPAHPKLIKVRKGRIKFTWSKVKGAFGYEIYRASSKKTAFKKVKSTTSLHYINYGLTKGRTYYYKVRAYKLVGRKKVYSKFTKTYAIKM